MRAPPLPRLLHQDDGTPIPTPPRPRIVCVCASRADGYALPVNSGSIRELGVLLKKNEGDLVARAEAALRVGVQWDTQVRPPAEHRVCQVFASALPVAYARGVRSADWEPFARLVLRGAYKATLAVGLCLSMRRGKRVSVFLTSLGGGAFGNQMQWIQDALTDALTEYATAPLDVVLVHFGHAVPGEWQGIGAPGAGGETS